VVLVQVAARDADAAEGARVRGEDAGGGGGARLSGVDLRRDLVAARREEVGVGEDERGGEPDGAPAAGERGGARAASLMGRRETTLRRSASGRELTRSTPPPSESKRMLRWASAETGGSGTAQRT
jgi:hypothetical protein